MQAKWDIRRIDGDPKGGHKWILVKPDGSALADSPVIVQFPSTMYRVFADGNIMRDFHDLSAALKYADSIA